MERLRQMILQGASSKALIEHVDAFCTSANDEEHAWIRVQTCCVESLQFASDHDCYIDARALYVFLKEIVHMLENKGYGEVILDEICELIVGGQQGAQGQSEDVKMVMYDIPEHLEYPVVINTLKSHNEVGAKLWEASLFIVEVCFHLRSHIYQKKLLELGTGVGNSGLLIAAHKAIKPSQLTLTDFAPEVLQNLQYNIDRSKQQRERKFNLGTDSSSFTKVNSAVYLDWTLADTMDVTGELSNVDVVLAADCTYEENLCVHLANTLRRVLLASKARRKGVDSSVFSQNCSQNSSTIFSRYPYALIACTVRNEDTLSIFLQRLEQIGAFVQDVTWIVIDGVDDNIKSKSSEESVYTDIGEHLIYPTHYLPTLSEEQIRSSLIRVIYVSFGE